MMTFADIRGALQERLASMPNELPISWENVEFDPNSQTYLRATLLSGDAEQFCLGEDGKNETNGIFQVDVFYQKGRGQDCTPDEIANWFERQYLTLNDTTVRCQSVSILQGEDDTNYFIVPVQITWQAITGARKP